MSSARDYILLEYGGVPDGAVLSGQMCPSCHGGNSKESSMSVGRTDGLLWWRCHRNKCSFRGMHGAKQDRQASAIVHPPGRWNYTTEPLSDEWLHYLSKRFRIPNEMLSREWQWTDGYGGRVVMPIKNERNITTAYTLRSYLDPEEGERDSKQGHRKALIHRVMEEAGQAWYQSTPYPSHVLIVEDQPSALRASTAVGVNAVALTGTYVPESLIDKLKFVYTHKPLVVVALDQDATPEAVEQVLKYRGTLDTLRVFPLDKDIKDHTAVEFKDLMANIKEMR